MAPSEEFLTEQVAQAKRDVENDLAELRTEAAALQRKIAMLVAILGGLLIALKVGRAIWRRSRD
jgi:hypothetical protein